MSFPLSRRAAIARFGGGLGMMGWLVTQSALAQAQAQLKPRMPAKTFRPIPAGGGGDYTALGFSPDGQRIAWTRQFGLQLRELATDKQVVALRDRTRGPAMAVWFSPDGKQLAAATHESGVHIWDLATGEQTAAVPGQTGFIQCVQFSPNGKRLASGGFQGVGYISDAATGTVQHRLKGHTNAVTAVAFCPDGKLLATGGVDTTVRLWEVASGAELKVLSGHRGPVKALAFSADGKWLASGNLQRALTGVVGRNVDADTPIELKVWDVLAGREKATLLSTKGEYQGLTCVAFSPDGRRLAAAGYDTTVRLLDAVTGQESLRLVGNEGSVNGLAFSPDGEWLAAGRSNQIIYCWEISPAPAAK